MPVTTPDINAQYEAWAQTDNLWLISMKGGGGGCLRNQMAPRFK